MLRRLAATLLSLATLSTLAAAQDFAKAPAAAGAPAPHAMRPPDDLGDVADPGYAPRRMHAPSRALVIRALAARRAQNLARFHTYRVKGVYPHDLVAQTTRNIWRDDEGHLCAAATILDGDGQRELVQQVADEQPNVKLGEVTSGPVLDWILTSGLTQVEVATIQEPMMGPREPAPRNDWRLAEDARLRRKYVRIEKTLRANTPDSLEQAADRLMQDPALAWRAVATLSAT